MKCRKSCTIFNHKSSWIGILIYFISLMSWGQTPPSLASNATLVVLESGRDTITENHLKGHSNRGLDDSLRYIITELPENGILILSDLNVLSDTLDAVGDVFLQQDILSSDTFLIYVHDSSETDDDLFKFGLLDTLRALNDLDPAYTFTIEITPVNDTLLRIYKSDTLRLAENETLSLLDSLNYRDADAHFGLPDYDSTKIKYRILHPPHNGYIGDDNGTSLATFTQDSLDRDLVHYYHDGNDTLLLDSIILRIYGTDSLGRTLYNGGILSTIDSLTDTVYLHITPVNDTLLRIYKSDTLRLAENETLSLLDSLNYRDADAHFGLPDYDSTKIKYRILHPPHKGYIGDNNGISLATFTQDSLDRDLVHYYHDGNDTLLLDSIILRIYGTDSLGRTLYNGGILSTIDSLTDTVYLHITPVNDTLRLIYKSDTLRLAENETLSLLDSLNYRDADAHFGLPDYDSTKIKYRILQFPHNGYIGDDNGISLATFTQDSLDRDLIHYYHDGNDTLLLDSIILRIYGTDSLGRTLYNGGILSTIDSLTDTVYLHITPVNDTLLRIYKSDTLRLERNDTLSLLDSLNYRDADAHFGLPDYDSTKIKYRILHPPHNGYIGDDDGISLATFTQDSLDRDLVHYYHDGNDTLLLDSIILRIYGTDSLGRTLYNGGILSTIDSLTDTVYLHITPVNDTLRLIYKSDTLRLAENETLSLLDSLNYRDADAHFGLPDYDSTKIKYRILQFPHNGYIGDDNGISLATFTQDSLDRDLVHYYHDGNDTLLLDSIILRIYGTDSLGRTLYNGGILSTIDSLTDTVYLHITPVNDTLLRIYKSDTLRLERNETLSLLDSLNYRDADAHFGLPDYDSTKIKYRILHPPHNGYIGDDNGISLATFTQDSLDRDLVHYYHDGNDTLLLDSIILRIYGTDSLGRTLYNGGILSTIDSLTDTVYLHITPVNDTLRLIYKSDTLRLAENETLSLLDSLNYRDADAHFGLPDYDSTKIKYRILHPPHKGYIGDNNGISLATFTQDSLDRDLVHYYHDGNDTLLLDSIILRIYGTDSLGRTLYNGGILSTIDSLTDTVYLHITPVNDTLRLIYKSDTLRLAENETLSLLDSLNYRDADAHFGLPDYDSTKIKYRILHPPHKGYIGDNNGISLATFTQDSLDRDLVHYYHDGNDTLLLDSIILRIYGTDSLGRTLYNGGILSTIDSLTDTVYLHITPVNDTLRLIYKSDTLRLAENETLSLLDSLNYRDADAHFGLPDYDSTKIKYRILHPPHKGYIGDNNGISLATFTQDSLDRDLVHYYHDGNDTLLLDSIILRIYGTDSLGRTLYNGGILSTIDSLTDTVYLHITPVNDTLRLIYKSDTLRLAENETLSLLDSLNYRDADAHFGLPDYDSTKIKYRILQFPHNGYIGDDNGISLATFTQDSLDRDLVHYYHDGNDTLLLDSIILRIYGTDSLGRTLYNGGILSTIDSLTDTVYLHITPVNDTLLRIYKSDTLRLERNETLSLLDSLNYRDADAHFGLPDYDSTKIKYRILHPPHNGYIGDDNGISLATFTQDSLDRDLVHYYHDGNDTLLLDSIILRIYGTDSLGRTLYNGGILSTIDSLTDTVYLHITPVNDTLRLIYKSDTLRLAENETLSLLDSLNYRDADAHFGLPDYDSTKIKYRILHPPHKGYIGDNNGISLATFTQDSLDRDLVHYYHDGNDTLLLDSIILRIYGTDRLGRTLYNGGILSTIDSLTDTVYLHITPVNDTLRLIYKSDTLRLAENETLSLLDSLNYRDADAHFGLPDYDSTKIKYRILHPPHKGYIGDNNGISLATFTQDSLDRDLVHYYHDGNDTLLLDSIILRIYGTDSLGRTLYNGGILSTIDSLTDTVYLHITPVNDTLRLIYKSDTLRLAENETLSLLDSLNYRDADAHFGLPDYDSTKIKYRILHPPHKGYIGDNNGISLATFTQDSLDRDLVHYYHDGNDTLLLDSIILRIYGTDSLGRTLYNGGILSTIDSLTDTVYLHITPVNDTLRLIYKSDTLRLAENETLSLLDSLNYRDADAHFGLPDYDSTKIKYRILHPPHNGYIGDNNGISLATFTQDSLDRDLVHYYHDGNDTLLLDSIILRIYGTDSLGRTLYNGGILSTIDSLTDTVYLHITPVNDTLLRIYKSDTLRLERNETLSLLDSLNYRDADAHFGLPDYDSTKIKYRILHPPHKGYIGDNNGISLATFTQDSLDRDLVHYYHDGNDTLLLDSIILRIYGTDSLGRTLYNGGILSTIDSLTDTVYLHITPVNDTLRLIYKSDTLRLAENETLSLLDSLNYRDADAHFGLPDYDSTKIKYRILHPPHKGYIGDNNGISLATFTQDSLDRDLVHYYHDGNDTLLLDSIILRIYGTDRLGRTLYNGGILSTIDSLTDTVYLHITPVNDTLRLIYKSDTLRLAENETLSLLDSLNYRDADAHFGLPDYDSTKIKYRILHPPHKGYIGDNNGISLATFTQDSLDRDLVHYYHDGNDTLLLDSIILRIYGTDSLGRTLYNGGILSTIDSLTDTVYLHITPVNDTLLRIYKSDTLRLAENDTLSLLDSLNYRDADAHFGLPDYDSTKIKYRILHPPHNGYIGDDDGISLATFTQDSLDRDLVHYYHDGNDTLLLDSIILRIYGTDSLGRTLYNGGILSTIDSLTDTVYLHITPVNDTLRLIYKSDTLRLAENDTLSLLESLNYRDADAHFGLPDYDSTKIKYRILHPPHNGYIGDDNGISLVTFTQDSLDRDLVHYYHDGNDTLLLDSIILRIYGTDSLGRTLYNGGILSTIDSLTDTVYLHITPVNDTLLRIYKSDTLRLAENDTLSLLESLNYRDADAHFGLPDYDSTKIKYRILHPPHNGYIGDDDGTSLATFTQDSLDRDLVHYYHDGNDTLLLDSIILRIYGTDSLGRTLYNGGILSTTDSLMDTVYLHITPVNDTLLRNHKLDALLDSGDTIWIENRIIEYDDPDTATTDGLEYVVTSVTYGKILGQDGQEIERFNQDSINEMKVRYYYDKDTYPNKKTDSIFFYVIDVDNKGDSVGRQRDTLLIEILDGDRVLILSEDTINFQKIIINKTVQHQLVLETGDREIRINSITHSLPNLFLIGDNKHTGFTIDASSKDTVEIRYAPTVPNDDKDTLIIYSTAYSSPDTIILLGESIDYLPEILLKAEGGKDILDFGDTVSVGDTAKLKLIIYNTGEDSLQIDGINTVSGYDLNWNKDTVLAADDSMLIEVSFIPTELKLYAGHIKVNGDALKGNKYILTKGYCTTKKITYIEENVEENLVVYPNPTRDYLYIENRKRKTIQLEIINLQGVKYEESIFDASLQIINLLDYPDGFYFVKMREGTHRTIIKKILLTK